MSWYPSTEIVKSQYKYLKLLQRVFFIQDTERNWIPYKLTPHQIHWHAGDVAVLGHLAKSRVVEKSRNTSFTTSGIISNLTAVPRYPEQVIPFVRLNETRANDLIKECRKLIKKMKPVLLENGTLWPFDPSKVIDKGEGTIIFPNGVEFRAFPATASASEIIRGLRISGSAGLLDETNFMRDFTNIFVALSDASAGEDSQGRSHFQMNIGTTLKGTQTPFAIWLKKEKSIQTSDIEIYSWPVFNPALTKFDIPFTEQPDLIPIVPWHSIEKLENRRKRDVNKLKEEYFCIQVDSNSQFYETDLILNCIDTSLKNYLTPPDENGIYVIGVDIASENDYYVFTIFQMMTDGSFIQRHLYYKRRTDFNNIIDFLPRMEAYAEKLIETWKPILVWIDSHGIGLQTTQKLQGKYGGIIKPIRKASIKGLEKHQSINLNEFIHTNQKNLMIDNKIKLLNDEIQIIHYQSWDYSYSADSTEEYGHGDTAIANAYAILPRFYKKVKKGHILVEREKISDIKQTEEIEW